MTLTFQALAVRWGARPRGASGGGVAAGLASECEPLVLSGAMTSIGRQKTWSRARKSLVMIYKEISVAFGMKSISGLGKNPLTGMLGKIGKLLIIASNIAAATSCAASETVSKINCEAYGDSVIASNTGEIILEQRLIKYQALEEIGSNGTGKRGGYRAICTIKNDPPGYKWVPCGKDAEEYITYYAGRTQKLFEVEEAIADSVQHRGWNGACKVKL